jgi:hypothetical protein
MAVTRYVWQLLPVGNFSVFTVRPLLAGLVCPAILAVF